MPNSEHLIYKPGKGYRVEDLIRWVVDNHPERARAELKAKQERDGKRA